jgi:hypothetical protein
VVRGDSSKRSFGEANTTKAKPALEGRALFGDEAPKFRSLAALNFPQIRHRVKRKQPFPLSGEFAPDSSPSPAGYPQPERRNHVYRQELA